MASHVGQRVKDVRVVKGWSAQQLADATESLGFPIKRSTIASLETGRRGVSLPDLLALAWALDVPPVMLLADFESERDVFPYLPGGESLRPTEFLTWWAGERYPHAHVAAPETPSVDRIERELAFHRAVAPLRAWREYLHADEHHSVMLVALAEARIAARRDPDNDVLRMVADALEDAYLEARRAWERAEEMLPGADVDGAQAAAELAAEQDRILMGEGGDDGHR